MRPETGARMTWTFEQRQEDRNPKQRIGAKAEPSGRHGAADAQDRAIGRRDHKAIACRHGALRVPEEKHDSSGGSQPASPKAAESMKAANVTIAETAINL